MSATIEDAVAAIEARASSRPEVGVVLGSGLGGFADAVEEAVEIPYGEIPGWPVSTAVGHAGTLVVGTFGGVPVAVLKGRAHLYEGHAPANVVFGVRVLGRLGVRSLVLTNACGRARRLGRPGHPRRRRRSPEPPGLVAARRPERRDPRAALPRHDGAYDPEYRAVARAAAGRLGLTLGEGVYAAWLGPAFETPAEIRMLRTLGADLVGMSTVPEVLAARHMGIRCLALSCVTNAAAGVLDEPIDHEKVLEIGARAAGDLVALLREVIPVALASAS